MSRLSHEYHGGGQWLSAPVYYPYFGWGFLFSPWLSWANWAWNWTTCPKCVAMVRTSSNYCNYCGNPMPRPAKVELKNCGACGSAISDSANFCQHCGEDTRDLKKLKMRMRFLWLDNIERRYASDRARFRASGLNAEDDKEEPALDKARRKAKDTNEPVAVDVVLLEKRGEIGSFPWAVVGPSGTVEYVYP